jgi:hypothetical protein
MKMDPLGHISSWKQIDQCRRKISARKNPFDFRKGIPFELDGPVFRTLACFR